MYTFHKNSHDHTDTVTIGNAIMSVIIAVNWTIVCISEKKAATIADKIGKM